MAHFCCAPNPETERIQKARKTPSWGRTRSPKRLEALARRFSNIFRADLVHGLERFKKRIPLDLIEQAWMSGDWSKIALVVPWQDLDKDLQPLNDSLLNAWEKFGSVGLEIIRSPEQKELRYDYKNPRIRRKVTTRIGEKIITPIKKGGLENIRKIVQDHQKSGMSPRQIAKEIKESLLLDPRRAQAQRNYAKERMKAGVDHNFQQNISSHYDRLLMERATMIARTETQNALNAGQLEVWREGRDQGLIPRNAQKRWVVDGNPCPDCIAMDQETVGLDESWETPDGDLVDIPSEIHPNCQCIMTIDF